MTALRMFRCGRCLSLRFVIPSFGWPTCNRFDCDGGEMEVTP